MQTLEQYDTSQGQEAKDKGAKSKNARQNLSPDIVVVKSAPAVWAKLVQIWDGLR
jgi:hypothetical protein